ncbi:NADH-FMN oxidoreductase RutF, flavin reductase (DIM6/NTAB) family [Roseovarius pacificus]|uniref:NADH-FMN oxidoreductase RutF, flavin reductase (DIM6/NTAB) family n=1 Tax=Roseovarius pacificus TaxID=337701 RepID=A0A1M7BBR6_9RHOB|nr:flavin reductase family protein [Roseovarius pacificus]GGO54892.1 monooxygenase [Roseovarius pacificus]SHL52381.1 NADH-FMN oxidoreductase RutF, flavin reductase (DIM6/NTAB) family [Roseovarius pacificus]
MTIMDPGNFGPKDFRNTLGHFCTGIAVITGMDNGVPFGFTCQSVVSLSLEPPLIGFSPAKTSETWPRLRDSKHFCVNILADDQSDHCRLFSRKAEDRFTDVGFHTTAAGLPILDGALAYIACDIETEHEIGDHYLVVGRVQELAVCRPEASPLLFFKGTLSTGTANVI